MTHITWAILLEGSFSGRSMKNANFSDDFNVKFAVSVGPSSSYRPFGMGISIGKINNVMVNKLWTIAHTVWVILHRLWLV